MFKNIDHNSLDKLQEPYYSQHTTKNLTRPPVLIVANYNNMYNAKNFLNMYSSSFFIFNHSLLQS